ncbi:ATP-binding cassette domain-containing protein [Granulicatella sp. 19428wC4_WM01]|uniref:ATP-binding cassette domain-containing protein n=1 Tax=Granulicatella sp. 19428wC4_WM01 TaxID=2782471 RepID=UPI0018842A27
MGVVLFTIIHASISYNDKKLIDINKLSFFERDKIGIVGKNGSGKTSLLKIISGDLVFENSQIDRQNTEFIFLKQSGNNALIQENYQEFDELLSKLQVFKVEFEHMSGGEKQKYLLSKILSSYGKVLLLDEPTTYLDIETKKWLIEYLKRIDTTMLIVSHDRELLDGVCNKIWEIEHEQVNEYHGNFNSFLNQKESEKRKHVTEYEKYISEKDRLLESLKIKQNLASKMSNVTEKKKIDL